MELRRYKFVVLLICWCEGFGRLATTIKHQRCLCAGRQVLGEHTIGANCFVLLADDVVKAFIQLLQHMVLGEQAACG